MSESQTVVAVRLRYNPKVFWFDPALSSYQIGDHVLVDTERGREIGLVVDAALEVSEKQIKDLKTPLKPVIRSLTEADFDRIDELDAKGYEAMPVFRELIERHQLDMKPVSVEFLFSGDKAVFYFSNDERVDFRDLVRDLAAHFRVRVDMRQIGVRDEARIIGGLAHCGEELCCARFGGEFQPVSIRMAKEQDLPLNPSKISGACGRLMCCLRYEFEAYKDFKGRAPKKGALIETPMGQAKVIDFDTPREIISMRLEDGKQFAIPLKEFGCTTDDNGKQRPCSISRDAIDRCASSSIIMALAALEQELLQEESSASDKSQQRETGRDSQRPTRRLRRNKRDSVADNTAARDSSPSAPEEAKERGFKQSAENKGKLEKIAPRRRNSQKSKPRPGQHSSGLRNSDHVQQLDYEQQTGRSVPQNQSRTTKGNDRRRPSDASEEKRSSEGRGEGRRRRRRQNNRPTT